MTKAEQKGKRDNGELQHKKRGNTKGLDKERRRGEKNHVKTYERRKNGANKREGKGWEKQKERKERGE